MGNASALNYDILDGIDYKNEVGWQVNKGKKKEFKEGEKVDVTIFRYLKPKTTTANSNGNISLPLVQRNIQKLRTIRHPFILSFVETIDLEDQMILITEQCIPLKEYLAKQLQMSKTNTSKMSNNEDREQLLTNELIWGLKCILTALEFIHSTCQLLHGNISMNSIFVTPNGDWKLAGFELASNFNIADDCTYFVQYNNHYAVQVLEKRYQSPERIQLTSSTTDIDSILKAKLPPYYIDIFSFGILVQECFDCMEVKLSTSFAKYIALTIRTDMKKRPTAKKLLTLPTFTADFIKVQESLQEFSVKNIKEIGEVLQTLSNLLTIISVPVATYKLLPNLARVLQSAINDFSLRDARESCRQSIVASVEMIGKLAELQKLEETEFVNVLFNNSPSTTASAVPSSATSTAAGGNIAGGIYVSLWQMTDRTVRYSLLSTLKALHQLLPAAAVQKHIFDTMIAGFSDSNAKMRENTLMSLIYVLDKLDDNQLQERLPRVVLGLQADAEASVRTNAIIFIGRLASRLRDPARQRVLGTALPKAMKDNFLYCRVAGLKAAIACVKLVDSMQLSGKIMPQSCLLLVDKSSDVRQLAAQLLELSLEQMKEHHQQMIVEAKASTSSTSKHSNPSDVSQDHSTSQGQGQQGVGAGVGGEENWSSWMLKGVVNSITTPQRSSSSNIGELTRSATHTNTTNTNTNKANNLSTAFDQESSSTKSNTHSSANKTMTKGKANFMDDFEDFDINQDTTNTNTNTATNNTASNAKGWDDDDLDDVLDDTAPITTTTNSNSKHTSSNHDKDFDDLDFDDDQFTSSTSITNNNNNTNNTTAATVNRTTSFSSTSSTPVVKENTRKTSTTVSASTSNNSINSLGTSNITTTTTNTNTAGTLGKASKTPKVAVKKLAVKKDEGWDDF